MYTARYRDVQPRQCGPLRPELRGQVAVMGAFVSYVCAKISLTTFAT